MPKYKIPMWQEVTVWQEVEIIIETDDDIDKVLKHLNEKDFFHTYKILDENVIDTNWETCEYGYYDYSDIQKANIEEEL